MEGYRRPMRKLLSRSRDRRQSPRTGGPARATGMDPCHWPSQDWFRPAVTKPHLAHAADFDGMHSIQRAMQVIGQPCTSGKGGTVHISARTPTHPNGAAPMFAPGSAR